MVTASDAESYASILVRELAAQHAAAAAAAGEAPGSDATVGRLLAGLGRDLAPRCAATRRLLGSPEGCVWLRAEVLRCTTGAMLEGLRSMLAAALGQAGGQLPPAEAPAPAAAGARAAVA